MEEVTVVDSMVADDNGGDVFACDSAITSVFSKEEPKQQVNDEELESAESTDGAAGEIDGSSTPIARSTSCRTARRKRGGAFGLFRAVYRSLSGGESMKKVGDAASPRKKAGADADDDDAMPTTASWKSIVDGMRPLRLPGTETEYYPPPPPPLEHVDVYHDVLLAPPSLFRAAGSEGGMTSRYASAQDLHLLDCGEDQADEEAAPAADGGSSPHAIDMQAEEFIAKFYEQFRQQKSEWIDQDACM